MGSTEDVRRKMDKLKELEDYIHEVNEIQAESVEETNVDDVLQEVDEGVSKDMLDELNTINVPTTIPEQVTENEQKESTAEKSELIAEEE